MYCRSEGGRCSASPSFWRKCFCAQHNALQYPRVLGCVAIGRQRLNAAVSRSLNAMHTNAKTRDHYQPPPPPTAHTHTHPHTPQPEGPVHRRELCPRSLCLPPSFFVHPLPRRSHAAVGRCLGHTCPHSVRRFVLPPAGRAPGPLCGEAQRGRSHGTGLCVCGGVAGVGTSAGL